MRTIPVRLVFVDVEVAGAEISRPIIQVAAIAVTGDFEQVESFEAKLKFDYRLADRTSLTKNRYCPKTWDAEARSATSVAREFARFLWRHAVTTHDDSNRPLAQLVAHNASFDGPFLRIWFDRVGKFFPGNYRLLCTVQRAQWLFQEHPQLRPPTNYKLGTLCEYFGVPRNPHEAHTALADVRATVELYRRMTLLATAESCNRLGSLPMETSSITRVAGVAGQSSKTCRSRRKPGRQTCRWRRRRFSTVRR